MELITIVVFILGLIIGAFVGIGLAGRSKVARAVYEEVRTRAERAEEQLREWRASVRNKTDS